MAETGKRFSIMVVDDTPTNIDILVDFLGGEYEVRVALDGPSALEDIRNDPPDLLLLDIMMPGMDGYEVCRRLKGDPRYSRIPIIFISAKSEVEDELRGFEIGAVDYIAKPFRPAIVKARVGTHLALKSARVLVESQKRLLEKQNEALRMERLMLEKILLKQRHSTQFDGSGLRYFMESLERTSGDLLLSATRPDKTRHILLGCFNGTGLPAAIGSPIVSETFYSMTSSGATMRDIVFRINQVLMEHTPDEVSLSACFLAVDPEGGRLLVWNCGMPDVLVFVAGASSIFRMASTFPPCGIAPPAHEGYDGSSMALPGGTRVFAFTHGLLEEKNPRDEPFGYGRVVETLHSIIEQKASLDFFSQRLSRFLEGGRRRMEHTLVEISC